MSRPVSLPHLHGLFDRFARGDATWPARVQVIGNALYAALGQPDALTDGQFAALVSLAESVTLPTLTGSTIHRLVNAGNHAMATYEFEKWVYGTDPVTGQVAVLDDLVERRKAEKTIWLA